jgi:hypothetical protein
VHGGGICECLWLGDNDVKLSMAKRAYKNFNNYLMRKIFEWRIEHNNFKYLFDQQNLNTRQARSLEFLYEFDLGIKHIKGKENKSVDELSKKMHLQIKFEKESY